MAREVTGNLRTPTGAANMRAAVDFTDVSKFNLYETGHGVFIVLDTPNMMKAILNNLNASKKFAYINEDGGISEADEIQNTVKYKGYVTKKENKPALKTAITEFPRILESEFKGIDGLDDMTSDTLEISDNISTLTVLGSVNYATNQEITLRFTEKAGRTITTYCSAYLRAIRDPRTRAKTYRGCANIFAKDATVSSGEQRIIYPSIENEIFTFLYIIPDSTWEVCEKVYLLANAQISKAAYSALDNFDKGDIANKEIDIPFNTFVITDNKTVNQMGNAFLSKYIARTEYIEDTWNINSEIFNYKTIKDNKSFPKNPTGRQAVN